MINRLVFGMILAALIVGSSLLVQAAPVENAGRFLIRDIYVCYCRIRHYFGNRCIDPNV